MSKKSKKRNKKFRERGSQGKNSVQSKAKTQSKPEVQSKIKSQSEVKDQSKTRNDPWEKDFIKEVEQAEKAAEVAEFDEEDLVVAIEPEHAPKVVSEVEGGGAIVEMGSRDIVSAPEEVPTNTETEDVTTEETLRNVDNGYNPAADLASDDDLKLLVETGVTRKPSLLHKINVKLPWLKVILLIILIVIMAMLVGKFVESQIVGKGASGNDTPDAVLDGQEIADQEMEPTEEIEQTAENEPATSAIPEATIPEGGTKLVALTFDDGPSGATTWRLLDILAEKQVRVTFFVLGNMVLKSPDLLRAELAAGHEVGSHTVTHANLSKSTVDGIRWERQRMNEIFQEVAGSPGPTIMRPPYGAVNDTVRAQVGQPMILWTVDTEDWRYRDPVEVRRRAMAGVFDGSIILMHDIHATTIDAVAGIIDDLRAAGYTIVTVSQLAAARGVVMENGWTYGSFRP